jgi:mannose-1-phosphate guanylyltransferase / phosphomannomutase
MLILRSNLVWGSRASRFLFGFAGIKGRLNAELNPEATVSLSAAFGFMLGKGKRVVVGREPGAVTGLLKDAVKVGLSSSGIEVYELGETTCAMLRLGVTLFGAQGGVYLHTPAGEEDALCLLFVDEEGINLSRNNERKMEQLYFRNDFARVSPGELMEEVRVPGLVERYREQLLGAVKSSTIQKNKFKIVISCPTGLARDVLIDLLEELGCSLYYVPLPPYDTVSPRRFARETVRELGEKVGADLGGVLNPDGERLFLTTASGRLLEDEELQALITLLQLRHRQLSSVAVPVTAPRVHEELARRFSGQVVRTRTSPRQRMEGLRGMGLTFLPQAFDGTRILLELLDFMSSEQKTLEQLLQEIPPFYMKENKIPCPWNQKGRIMRQLVQEADSDQVELIEGLKVYRPEGWALALPDPEEAAYRVIGEGNTEESANSLADFYAERVRLLQKENNTQ